MNTRPSKKSSHLKNTIVGVVALSALTGGLLLLEDYRSNKEAMKFSEHLSRYTVPVKVNHNGTQTKDNNAAFFKRTQDSSLLTTDVNEQATIAEQNLLTEQVQPLQNSSEVNQLSADNNINASQENKNDVADVYFALSSSVIAPEYKLELVSVAEHIKSQTTNKKWQVVGHTDKSGSATYNLKLAKERAKKVADFLVNQGVAEEQITLLTLGEYEAMKLDNSTYNYGLRKVRVMEYKPETQKLAITVQKRNEQMEQRRVARIMQMKLEKQRKQEEKTNLLAKQQEKVTSHDQKNTPINMHVNDPDTVQVNTDLLLDEINLGFGQQDNSEANLSRSNSDNPNLTQPKFTKPIFTKPKSNQNTTKTVDETTTLESNDQLRTNKDQLNADEQVNNKKEVDDTIIESAQVSSIINIWALVSSTDYSL